MACPSPTTGAGFVIEMLGHLDCQAQTLGTFGFQSLASPGSPAALVLTSVLTLFVAIYGIRLLFGPGDAPAGLVDAVLKIGIVLTIAVSWPAWRVVAYDVVFYGPPEVAATIMPSTMPDPRASLPQRLQGIDSAMAALTVAGSGRESGVIVDQATGFRSIALVDETGLGWARTIYLAATIGTLGFLRISGGLLLAIAPLMAGLLLFNFSRGIFGGWVRGLVFVALGSLGTTIVLAVQIAAMEPWVADALQRRNLGYPTPAMPTELLAMALAFAIALAGVLFLLARVAFQNSWTMLQLPAIGQMLPRAWEQRSARYPQSAGALPVHSRAAAIGESVSTLMRREETRGSGGGGGAPRQIEALGRADSARAAPEERRALAEPLGSGYRRSTRRETASQRSRDKRD